MRFLKQCLQALAGSRPVHSQVHLWCAVRTDTERNVFAWEVTYLPMCFCNWIGKVLLLNNDTFRVEKVKLAMYLPLFTCHVISEIILSDGWFNRKILRGAWLVPYLCHPFHSHKWQTKNRYLLKIKSLLDRDQNRYLRIIIRPIVNRKGGWKKILMTEKFLDFVNLVYKVILWIALFLDYARLRSACSILGSLLRWSSGHLPCICYSEDS